MSRKRKKLSKREKIDLFIQLGEVNLLKEKYKDDVTEEDLKKAEEVLRKQNEYYQEILRKRMELLKEREWEYPTGRPEVKYIERSGCNRTKLQGIFKAVKGMYFSTMITSSTLRGLLGNLDLQNEDKFENDLIISRYYVFPSCVWIARQNNIKHFYCCVKDYAIRFYLKDKEVIIKKYLKRDEIEERDIHIIDIEKSSMMYPSYRGQNFKLNEKKKNKKKNKKKGE